MEFEDDDVWYKSKSDRALRRKRNYRKKKRLLDMAEAFYFGAWADENNTHIHHRKNSKTEQYYKKLSNRKVRRYKDELQNSSFKKVFDLWWTLY